MTQIEWSWIKLSWTDLSQVESSRVCFVLMGWFKIIVHPYYSSSLLSNFFNNNKHNSLSEIYAEVESKRGVSARTKWWNHAVKSECQMRGQICGCHKKYLVGAKLYKTNCLAIKNRSRILDAFLPFPTDTQLIYL